MITDTKAMRLIHRHLVAPFEWDSGTIEGVAEILAKAGYGIPAEPFVDRWGNELDEIDINDRRLRALRPAAKKGRA